MILLHPPFRLADRNDGKELAELVNFAGEGLPYHIWCELADDDHDPWEIGRERQAERAEKGQIVVVDLGEGAIAGLTGHAIGADPKPVGEEMPAMFRPLQELENQALNSWYVNVLACYPDHRGKGYGTRLLGIAEQIAAASKLEKMSVIVAGNNAGAKRLYEKQGYQEIARRPCISNGWQTDTKEWVLLIKNLSL